MSQTVTVTISIGQEGATDERVATIITRDTDGFDAPAPPEAPGGSVSEASAGMEIPPPQIDAGTMAASEAGDVPPPPQAAETAAEYATYLAPPDDDAVDADEAQDLYELPPPP